MHRFDTQDLNRFEKQSEMKQASTQNRKNPKSNRSEIESIRNVKYFLSFSVDSISPWTTWSNNGSNKYTQSRPIRGSTATKELRFTCDICKVKSYTRRENLYRHKRVECQKKPKFQCFTCFKYFYYRSTLATHVISHTARKRPSY